MRPILWYYSELFIHNFQGVIYIYILIQYLSTIGIMVF